MSFRCIEIFIVGDIIDVVFLEKRFVNHPRCFSNDFVHPSAMSHGFQPTKFVIQNLVLLQKGPNIYRSAWVMTVRALRLHTCSSEFTPTRRYTDGKESLACRNWSECLKCKVTSRLFGKRRIVHTQNGRDHKHLSCDLDVRKWRSYWKGDPHRLHRRELDDL